MWIKDKDLSLFISQPKYEEALKHEETLKIVTPDWVTDSINKGDKHDETLYHPRLIVYPKPPSPPKPETPPKPEPMEVNVLFVMLRITLIKYAELEFNT